MNAALNRFITEIDEAKALTGVYDHLVNTLGFTPGSDVASTILRHQLVIGISALDLYLHTIVRLGIIEIYNGTRVPTKKFKSHPMKAEILMKIVELEKNPIPMPTSPEELPHGIISAEFQAQMKTNAFQDPEKIKDALSYIWNEDHKFIVIARTAGFPGANDNQKEKNMRQRMKLLCERRNQIVHENDKDLTTFTRRTIDRDEIADSLDFIKTVGVTIGTQVTRPECYVTPTT